MSKLFSIEFWIATQLFIDLVLVMLMWRLVRKIKKMELEQQNLIRHDDLKFLTDSIHQEVVERIEMMIHGMGEKAAVEMVDRAAQDIIDLLDPLVKGSESAATTFDHQIKEKQRLIKSLNDALDARIISINLLLSRAEVVLNTRDKSIYMNNSGRSESASGLRVNPYETSSGLEDNENSLRDNSSELLSNSIYNRESPFQKGASGNHLNGAFSSGENSTQESMFDQQQRIIEWYLQGLDVDTIASKLSMPRGEVQLVISLKEKFIRMEKEP